MVVVLTFCPTTLCLARIAVPNLVLWTSLSKKRHPDYVSNDCDNALSVELLNLHGVRLHLDFYQKGSEV